MGTEHGIVAIYEGDPLMSSLLTEILDAEGYRTVLLADRLGAVVDASRARAADLLLVDLVIERSALARARRLIDETRRQALPRRIPALGLTTDFTLLRRASSRLADLEDFALLPKPFSVDALMDVVASLDARTRGANGAVATGAGADMVGLLYADPGGRYTDANERALALLGYSREELLERRVADVMVSTQQGVSDEWTRYQRERSWTGADVALRRKDGQTVRVRIHAAVLQGEGGRPDHVAWIRPADGA